MQKRNVYSVQEWIELASQRASLVPKGTSPLSTVAEGFVTDDPGEYQT